MSIIEPTTSAPHYAGSTITLHHGDCLDALRSLSDVSIDAVVTDPPYGIRFMGQAWDGADIVNRTARGKETSPMPPGIGGPNGGYRSAAAEAGRYDQSASANQQFQTWVTEWAVECLRVLKPGGHLLASGSSRTGHRLAAGIEDAGFEIRDSIAWLYGSGFPKSLNLTDDDGQRTGWGTALKPAFEPIVVARKPLMGTVAANVLTHGTGALNVDGCRVAGGDTLVRPPILRHDNDVLGKGLGAGVQDNPSGRWPANVVLDASQAEVLDEQSGTLTSGTYSGKRNGDKFRDVYGEFGGTTPGVDGHDGSTGGASRFFYVAKADASERVRVNGIAHPTVKPLALMRWLVRLVTPPGGTVLEPFAGSGTTVEACILEGFRCIAIEREADYLPLVVQRINRRRDPVEAVRGSGEDGGLFDLLGEASA
ncbi:MAG: site-specific DNA-methyltransferase [Nocardioides sp.]|nr:site-specific DNA-methyltransferase [Nocardioides sp.]